LAHGRFITEFCSHSDWYALARNWTPDVSTIGLIWQILYPIIFITMAFVFIQAVRWKTPWTAALPFAINLVANLAFTRS
jgi:tryptophan-rich sensory protein